MLKPGMFEERARELLTRERLSVKHNSEWLASALAQVRIETIEECAKVCDEGAAFSRKLHEAEKDTGRDGGHYWSAINEEDLAHQIRALDSGLPKKG
jgi:hypothetical protein